METALAGIALLVAVTWWISRVNARYEERAAEEGPSADEVVETAWDAHGLGDNEAQLEEQFAALMRTISIDALKQKNSLVRVAVMAVRAGEHEVLNAVASRAEQVAGGCGETLSLRGLAAAYGGGETRAERLQALEMVRAAQMASAGCSRCNAGLEAQVLGQEVALAEAMVIDELRALDAAPAESVTSEEPADEAAPAPTLFVRKISAERAGD